MQCPNDMNWTLSLIHYWWYLLYILTIFNHMLTCIFLSKILGPSIMKDRPAYNLKKTIMFYNLFQVLFSGYVFYEAGMAGWWTGYNWLCQDIDRAADPDSKGKLLRSLF